MVFRKYNIRSAKTTPAKVLEIRQRYAAGESQGSLARDPSIGLSVNQIGRIVRGECWKQYHQHLTMPTGDVSTDVQAEVEASLGMLVREEPKIDAVQEYLNRRKGGAS